MIRHFRVPGEATKRDYVVYVMVATHRGDKQRSFYVGKTGDNFDGCNPIISRAGNHLSFNRLHSQTRNHLGNPEEYDFDFFYATFGGYVPKAESRDGLNVINAMERELNVLASAAFGVRLLNPVKQGRRIPLKRREMLKTKMTEERKRLLEELIQQVAKFVASSSNEFTAIE